MAEKQNVPAWLDRALDPTTPTTENNETVRTENNYFDDIGAEIIYPTIRMGEDGSLYKPEDPMQVAIDNSDYIVVEGPPNKETSEKATQISKSISRQIEQSRTRAEATDQSLDVVSFNEGGLMADPDSVENVGIMLDNARVRYMQNLNTVERLINSQKLPKEKAEKLVDNSRYKYQEGIRSIQSFAPEAFKVWQDSQEEQFADTLNTLAFESNPSLPYDEELGDELPYILTMPYGSEDAKGLNLRETTRGFATPQYPNQKEVMVSMGSELDPATVARHEGFHELTGAEPFSVTDDSGEVKEYGTEYVARAFDYLRALVEDDEELKTDTENFVKQGSGNKNGGYTLLKIALESIPQLYERGVFDKNKVALETAQQVIQQIDEDEQGFIASLLGEKPDKVKEPTVDVTDPLYLVGKLRKGDSDAKEELKKILSVLPFSEKQEKDSPYKETYSIDRSEIKMNEGGLMLAPGGAIIKKAFKIGEGLATPNKINDRVDIDSPVDIKKPTLSPTLKALSAVGVTTLGLTSSEEVEAAYIPLKAFKTGSDAAKVFFLKAQKRIDEGADTSPNGELYDEMGVYRSEDGDLKVDVPELRARDLESTAAMGAFKEDIDYYLKSSVKRKKSFEFPISRYLPENSPIFQNFPDLKDATVHIVPRSKKNSYYGSYNPGTKRIEITIPTGEDYGSLDADVAKGRQAHEVMNSFNTLLHEFQHYIQDVKKSANTGFDPTYGGVGLQGFELDYRAAVNALRELDNPRLDTRGEVIPKPRMSPERIALHKDRVDKMNALARDSIPSARERIAFDKLNVEEKIKKVDSLIVNYKKRSTDVSADDKNKSRRFGYGIYIRELGEAEARSTGMKGLLPEGEARKRVGVFYPKATERSVLSPEDVDWDDELENTHTLVRLIPSFENKYSSKLEFTEQPKGKPSKGKPAETAGETLGERFFSEKPSKLKSAATAGAVAVGGLGTPPSQAFVSALGFEDATPSPSFFDTDVPNALGITNTFLLDLLVPRIKPYDIITDSPLGVPLMLADGLGSFRSDEPQDYPEVLSDGP